MLKINRVAKAAACVLIWVGVVDASASTQTTEPACKLPPTPPTSKINSDSIGGAVRGGRLITIVVRQGRNDIENASVEIYGVGCKLLAKEETDDFGELKRELKPGPYYVTVIWKKKALHRSIWLDEKTSVIHFEFPRD